MAEKVTPQDLYQHLQDVIRDTEALLQATASYAGDKADQARTRAGESLRAAKVRLSEMQDDVMDRTRDYVKQSDQYVRDNPWQSVGLAAGLGLLLGALLIGTLASRRD